MIFLISLRCQKERDDEFPETEEIQEVIKE